MSDHILWTPSMYIFSSTMHNKSPKIRGSGIITTVVHIRIFKNSAQAEKTSKSPKTQVFESVLRGTSKSAQKWPPWLSVFLRTQFCHVKSRESASIEKKERYIYASTTTYGSQESY